MENRSYRGPSIVNHSLSLSLVSSVSSTVILSSNSTNVVIEFLCFEAEMFMCDHKGKKTVVHMLHLSITEMFQWRLVVL